MPGWTPTPEMQNVLSTSQCQYRRKKTRTTRILTLRSRSRSRVTGDSHPQRLRQDPTRRGVRVGRASSSSGGLRLTAVTGKSQQRWSAESSDDEGEARQENAAASKKCEKSDVRQDQNLDQSQRVLVAEETITTPAPAKRPSFAELVRFLENVKRAAGNAQSTWPHVVDKIAFSLPEMMFPEMNPLHEDFRLGVCICSLYCLDQLKLTLPLLLFNLMPQAGTARVYLLISSSDEETLRWLLDAMIAALHMHLLVVCTVDEAPWHFAEWHNFIIDFAAKDGATVVNLFNLLNHSTQ